MARGFHAAETIARLATEVWVRLTDFTRAGDWMPRVEWIEPPSGGALAVGTRLRFRARGHEQASEVTAFEPGRRIALTSTQGGVTATYTYGIESLGDRTRVTLDGTCEARGLWRLVHPLIAFAMRRTDGGQLARLKAALEA